MKTKLHFYTSLLLFLFFSNLWGQGEGNNWYFGTYAGLTFNTSPPSILNDGRLATSEGCASVSSKDGNLAFYTDGSIVYDANHNIMPNGTGLFGNPSSTQSSVVCPKPGTYNYASKRFDNYYILTIEVLNGTSAGGNNGGVRYTEVDMTLNGGMGDVVTSQKNIHLFGTTTMEGAGIAKHANGCDYWFIGKPVGNNNIHTYHVSSTGVNTTPVVSSTGPVINPGWGSIKASPDNSYIGIASNGSGTNRINVYDFNNSTGAVAFKYNDVIGGYSLEFSPNSQILYSTILNNRNIYQYDLTTSTSANFRASRVTVATTANTIGYDMCGLQIAPDGKIYAALQQANRLGAIQNPDILGVGCGYNDNEFTITGNNTNGTAMNVVLGLPAFPSFFIFPNELQYESANYSVNQYFCNSDSITFKISDVNAVQSVDWHIAPLNSNYNTTPDATSLEYTIPPPTSGSYKVLSIVNYACFIDSLIDTINVNAVPVVNLGPDIDSCTNGSILIDGTSNNVSGYLWNDATNLATNSFNTTGQYHLQVTDPLGCINSDTINITVNEVPSSSYLVTNTCLNDSSIFSNQSSINTGSIITYEWNFGNGNSSSLLNPSHLYTTDGNYNVQLIVTSNNNCKDTVILPHTIYPIPTTEAGLDTVLNCLITSIELDGSSSSAGMNYDYLWSTVDGNFTTSVTNDSVTINETGWYYLTVTDNSNNCYTSDSTLVRIDTLKPNFDIGTDNILTCEHPSITLNAINNQTGNFTYSWITNGGNIVSGNNTLSPEINQVGLYYLTVLNTTNQCLSNDSLTITIDTIHPIVSVGADTLINCINPSIYLSGFGSSTGNFSYLWQSNIGNILSGNTTLVPEISAPGTYTLTVTNNFNGCTSSNQTVVTQNDSAFVSIIFNGSSNSTFSIFSFDQNEITYQGNNGNIEWSIDDVTQTNDSLITYTFEESGNHEIIIKLTNSENGCIVYDTTNLLITHRLEIPNALSPNADGYNDEFIIRALENYESNSISIFNRWGEPIFEASPYLNDWSGQTNSNNILLGNKVVDGTYFYVVTLQDNGQEFIYKGYIEVKR